MNIFEDLIEELKDENLIEKTVIETSKAETDAKKLKAEELESKNYSVAETVETAQIPIDEPETIDSTESIGDESSNEVEIEEIVQPEEPIDEAEFYRRRAINEIDFLQIVEHVFAGVEREQLKIVPNTYDDLKVKTFLHTFLQISQNGDSAAQADAQFKLLQETESWHSSLALRDMRVLTANLRRFCETSRPPLSSPALIALARFYRNSPYSEQVRSKFDLIVTRLFSKEDESRREMVFTRVELVAHIKELYAEWSSVPMYSTEADDAQLTQTVAQFEEFISEAEAIETFDDLINNNFYNRLRVFKESTNEDFYAPEITAIAVETNVRVGNCYIELLNREKEKGNDANLKEKYGLAHDQAISEATGKTVSLIELLKQKKPEPSIVAEKAFVPIEHAPVKEKVVEKVVVTKTSGVAKWIIAALVLTIILGGVYFITTSNAPKQGDVSIAPKMNLGNSMLKEYLEEARIQDETLNGIVLPAWAKLSDDKKKEVLKQTLILGGEKGYKKVELKNKEGKTVGTAEGENISVAY